MTSHEPDPDQILGRIYRVLIRRWDSHWYRDGPTRAGSAGRKRHAAEQAEHETETDDQREEDQPT